MDKKYGKIQRHLSLNLQKEIIRVKTKPIPKINLIISQPKTIRTHNKITRFTIDLKIILKNNEITQRSLRTDGK